MSVGTSLQSIRSAAGLSVAQLATKSRIPASVIADLERDDFSTCGGAAYARGHIRTISRICGADTEAILAQFESQTIPLSKSIEIYSTIQMSQDRNQSENHCRGTRWQL